MGRVLQLTRAYLVMGLACGFYAVVFAALVFQRLPTEGIEYWVCLLSGLALGGFLWPTSRIFDEVSDER